MGLPEVSCSRVMVECVRWIQVFRVRSIPLKCLGEKGAELKFVLTGQRFTKIKN